MMNRNGPNGYVFIALSLLMIFGNSCGNHETHVPTKSSAQIDEVPPVEVTLPSADGEEAPGSIGFGGSGENDPAHIPEPSTLILTGAGLFILFRRIRKFIR
jgi:hypothetical protein